MTERPAPYNEDVEQSLIGSMILDARSTELALTLIVPEDFYAPLHQVIVVTIEQLHRRGEPVDVLTVADEMTRAGTDYTPGAVSTRLMECMGQANGVWAVEKYCRMVVDLAGRRRMIAVLGEMQVGINDAVPTEELVEAMRVQLDAVGASAAVTVPEGLEPMDLFLDSIEQEPTPWLIPGLLKADWRIILVGAEGSGKTTLIRQLAFGAAGGRHPLSPSSPMDPVRTLIVDLENPRESVESVCRPMYNEIVRAKEWDPDQLWIFHRPGGINLRNRHDRVEFESVLRAARPDLVCFGPIYKSYEVTGIGEEEIAVKQVTQVLDDLRTRYNFGLLLEHHAPHGEDAKRRAMRPHGSVLWMRWPELGIGMTPVREEDGSFFLSRFRGDRLENQWPMKISRSGRAWPWEGTWPDGTFIRSQRQGEQYRPPQQEEAPF